MLILVLAHFSSPCPCPGPWGSGPCPCHGPWGQVLVLVLVLVGQVLVLILILVLVVQSLSLSLFIVLARTCFHYSIIPIYSHIIVVSMHTISFNYTYLSLSCRHNALRLEI